MKLIIRADDMGMSEAVNYGCYRAITQGVVTTVGIMPNMKDTKHAINLIKSIKHLSVGIHTHLMGLPCAAPALIPSLVDTDGTFVKRQHRKLVSDRQIEVEDVIRELEAEYQVFVSLYGEKPAYFEVAAFEPEICKGLAIVARRHQIPFNVIAHAQFKIGGLDIPPCEKEYAKMNLIAAAPYSGTSLQEMKDYYFHDVGNLLSLDHVMMAFHPGYLDAYVLENSTLHEQRAYDSAFLCCEEFLQWLHKNKIELLTLRELIAVSLPCTS